MATDTKESSKDSPAEARSTKFYTRAEVANNKDSKETWMIIHNKVYNVTAFLNEHPGGEEVLLEQAGADATEAFEDIGHSSEAREMMKPYEIGEIVEEEKIKGDKGKDWSIGTSGDSNSSGSWSSWLIPIAIGVLATLVYCYFINAQ